MSVLKNFMFKRIYGFIALGVILLIFPTFTLGQKMATKTPQYGGTFTTVGHTITSWDPHIDLNPQPSYVYEQLGFGDWSKPRDQCPWTIDYSVKACGTTWVAERYEIEDPETMVFYLRKGIHFHNRPPTNGREMTAKDVVYSFHRLLGLGSGFTEASKGGQTWDPYGIKSVEARDEYTVVIKHKPSIHLENTFLTQSNADKIFPKEHGDLTDWKEQVGTGAWMLKDYQEGSSVTWEKNPDYWGSYELDPQYKLPFLDQVRWLIIKETATRMAAIRTGQVDHIGKGNIAALNIEEFNLLKKTHPDIQVKSWVLESWAIGYLFDDPNHPWADQRVRKAMQMAMNYEEMSSEYYQGHVPPIIYPALGESAAEFFTPLSEMPKHIREAYEYNPEGAKRLLADAGYPNGFKTTIHAARQEQDWNIVQIATGYLREIGIEAEIIEMEWGDFWTMISETRAGYELHYGWAAVNIDPLLWATLQFDPRTTSCCIYNLLKDPTMEILMDAAINAKTHEDFVKAMKAVTRRWTEQHYQVSLLPHANFQVWHPYIGGFDGEILLGLMREGPVYARIWIDQDLKKEMGF